MMRHQSTYRPQIDGLTVEARTFVDTESGSFEAEVTVQNAATGKVLAHVEHVPLDCNWPGQPHVQVEAMIARMTALPMLGGETA